jgi:heterodisulfide reductase subunit A
LPVTKAALIVGGGIAGMTSALSLANQGIEVHLVEKEKDLGGMALRIRSTLDGLDVQSYIKELIQKVYKHPQIQVAHSATITDVTGYVGNFVTTVKFEGRVKEIAHGAAILATGADEYKPTEYLYGDDERVLTQLELEGAIAAGDKRLANATSLAMIQCVGCRSEEKNYCARVCCGQAVKNSLKLRDDYPELDIYIFYRDMRTYGFSEDAYREAAEKGIRFVRFEADAKPELETATDDEGRPVLRLTVPDPVLQKKLEVDSDLVVLSAAVVPAAGASEVARWFKVAMNPDGFFQEAHVKLRPVDFAADGVFLGGMNHYPKNISETIAQALGAAGRAGSLLSQDTVTASGSVCEVEEDDCVSCGACITACTYGAISFQDTPKGAKAVVNPVLCKGDGLCSAKCPTSAIVLKHFTDKEVMDQIDAALL